MGQDKALLPVEGVALAARVAEVLRASGADPVAAIGGDGPALELLGLGWWPDRYPGEGPLGGVLTALAALGHRDVVAVLATDLPDVDAATILALLDALGGHDAAVADTGRLEPLCGVWRTRTCTPVLAAAFEVGERAVHRAMVGLDVVEVPVPAARLRNINTPHDLGR
jgi:molybdopterin-guanine dinucleotide biosynthesis protein A